MAIKHAFTSAVADGGNANLVQPSNWNADHTLEDATVTYAKIQNVSATDKMLGRSTAGAGVIEEIPVTAAGRALLDDANAAAQRTTLGLGTAALSATGDFEAAGAVATHAALADPHTGYRLESADHTHQSTGAQAGQLDHGLALTGLTDDDHTQYLKERASGGVESEVPEHEHGSTTKGGVLSTTQRTRTITFIIDGGGVTITTGIKGDLEIPFACTIVAATLLADQSGSIVIDIWKDTYANYPPTVADTITASAKPTISTATKSQDTTLTGWTTAITAGDTLRFNVDSVTTIQRVTLSLKVTVA